MRLEPKDTQGYRIRQGSKDLSYITARFDRSQVHRSMKHAGISSDVTGKKSFTEDITMSFGGCLGWGAGLEVQKRGNGLA